MGGVDTIRGIAYQQAQAVLCAIDVLNSPSITEMRVEGINDVVDIELFEIAGVPHIAKQIKSRAKEYTWGKAELLRVLRDWALLPSAQNAFFEFVTNGRLGSTGEEVFKALDEARAGQLQSLGDLLAEPVGSEICKRLAKARIHIDPASTSELLMEAEKQVVAMLSQPRTTQDAREQAQRAVDRLFIELMKLAGQKNPDARLIQRNEIAKILGVPANQSAGQQWPGNLRSRYLIAAQITDEEIVGSMFMKSKHPIKQRIYNYFTNSNEAVELTNLLSGNSPVILVGSTGTGKTTATGNLRRMAAADGEIIFVAQGETYLPGRIAALVADALSSVLGEEFPEATGRQILADSGTTLIIDGVSEIPEDHRKALAEDLLAPMAAGRGLRVVVVGRDIAALRSVFPSSIMPSAYAMHVLNREERLNLARNTLSNEGDPSFDSKMTQAHISTLVAQTEHALLDAAGNPLLFAMALSLLHKKIPFTNRAAIYQEFVTNLAERSGGEGIGLAPAVLGFIFAKLLDGGRRYSDPYEWEQLLIDASDKLVLNDPLDAQRAAAAARRCGLITTLGFDQRLIPMHDSFADYFAGYAHAHKLATLPPHLRDGDKQRLLFAAEIGGVDSSISASVTSDLPFLAVQISSFDNRPPMEGDPQEVESLLHNLLPTGTDCHVAIWRRDSRIIVFRRPSQPSEWVDSDTGSRLFQTLPSVVGKGGPLDIAVRLWRQELLAILTTKSGLSHPHAKTTEEALAILTDHASKSALAILQFKSSVSPPNHLDSLTNEIGLEGIDAIISPAIDGVGGMRWPVTYRPFAGVNVVAQNSVATEPPQDSYGASTVEFLVSESPEAVAAQRVRTAINNLVAKSWL